jgi:hypothetical protein
MDYRRIVLTKTSTSTSLPDSRIGASLVVGLCVEKALKLGYAPEAGKLPILLERQGPEHHQSVVVHGVRVEGKRAPFSATVKVGREGMGGSPSMGFSTAPSPCAADLNLRISRDPLPGHGRQRENLQLIADRKLPDLVQKSRAREAAGVEKARREATTSSGVSRRWRTGGLHCKGRRETVGFDGVGAGAHCSRSPQRCSW